MNVENINEEPLLTIINPCVGDPDLMIYAADLKAAEVGQSWGAEVRNPFIDRDAVWYESYTVVYKDNHGVAVLLRKEGYGYNDDDDYVELLWIELH